MLFGRLLLASIALFVVALAAPLADPGFPMPWDKEGEEVSEEAKAKVETVMAHVKERLAEAAAKGEEPPSLIDMIEGSVKEDIDFADALVAMLAQGGNEEAKRLLHDRKNEKKELEREYTELERKVEDNERITVGEVDPVSTFILCDVCKRYAEHLFPALTRFFEEHEAAEISEMPIEDIVSVIVEPASPEEESGTWMKSVTLQPYLGPDGVGGVGLKDHRLPGQELGECAAIPVCADGVRPALDILLQAVGVELSRALAFEGWVPSSEEDLRDKVCHELAKDVRGSCGYDGRLNFPPEFRRSLLDAQKGEERGDESGRGRRSRRKRPTPEKKNEL